MNPVSLKFCPRCGSSGYQYREKKYWYCPVCLFTYYHNVAVSASVILPIHGSVLFVRRNKDPGNGMLSLPGGFVDPSERAEDAAVRECFEETGLRVSDVTFVGSWPNSYAHKGVTYSTCDIYFKANLESSLASFQAQESEVSSYVLVSAEQIATAPIAFESHRAAVQAFFTS